MSLAGQIRLQKIAIRQSKPSYKYLNDQEKKLMKALNDIDEYERQETRFWRSVDNFRDANNHVIWTDSNIGVYDLISGWLKDARTRRDNVIKKNNWTDSDVDRIRESYKQYNCRSVSF